MLFRSIECAENLTWHASERIEDGKLRHPADSPAWKLVDFKWPDFGSEPRNLRLALSVDGVNPHGDMSSKYSCWPIVMVIYNLPPWLCMKRKYMMLSMLISGPKQPGDDIDTYLAPLIEDLKLLWENGVEWYKACLICGDNTNSIRLRHGKKIAYLGHRRFLARDHPYRRQKKSFNDKKELGTIPEPLSGEDVYLKLKDLEFSKGKKIHKNLSMNRSEKICWNRLSSFFELPYWKDLHVRHCLDVMYIEKNVCMNILGTLLDIPGKSKDGLNVRRDLVDLKLRPKLAPISSEKKIFIPPTCYTLTKEEKRCVLKTLSRIKIPEGYSSNIGNLVSMTDLKLNYSLKTHDCHVLIQQLFSIAIRSVLPKHVRYAITRLCIFFNFVCNKVLDMQQLDKLEEDIVVSTELEVGNNGVSDNLRWVAHGSHHFVITYSGYAINGCHYHIKSCAKDRSVQNSGVSLVAKTMQVSSSKDKNPVIGDMSFYGVIQEIWELNYNTFNVLVFKCDWVQNSGGVRINELGYILVDLNRVGHKSDSFILASQAKKVYYIEDPSDVRWSVVLTPPQRDFEDRYNDEELGDTILRCEGIPNDMPDVDLNNDLDDNISTYVRSDCEGT
ncbi:hypothetical protein IC582_004595 [Cucumis melo]